jgi:hypothetical protein
LGDCRGGRNVSTRFVATDDSGRESGGPQQANGKKHDGDKYLDQSEASLVHDNTIYVWKA